VASDEGNVDDNATVLTKNIRKDPLYVELCNVFDGLEDGIRESGKNKFEMTMEAHRNT